MDLDQIQELLRIVAESGVAEVTIEEDDLKLTIRQHAPTVMMQPASMPSYAAYPPPPFGGYGGPPGGYAQPGGGYGQGGGGYPQAGGYPPQGSGAAAPPQAEAAPRVSPSPGDEAPEPEAPSPTTQTVTAPIVGTFYRAPAPDADPFVAVGDTVAEGDVLCIIEAMKLMNEIECEMSGTLRAIHVQNAEPVEFDQPLFEIEPS